jgi:hypothetical protein
MLVTDMQGGDVSFASHTDGGLRVNAEVSAGVGGCEERFKTFRNSGAISAHEG